METTARQASHGVVENFSAFMQRALYHPQYGYYQQPRRQGLQGDYITAPSISPAFAQALAGLIAPILRIYPHWSICELGPGEADLSLHLLQALHALGLKPKTWFLVENARNKHEYLYQRLQDQGYHQHFTICSSIPEYFQGLVIANEVLDALPVHLLQSDDQAVLSSLVVKNQAGQYQWHTQPAAPQVLKAFEQRNIPLYANYRYEISLAIPEFIHHVTQRIDQGLCLLMDYGYSRATYYQPQRALGTLCCYYQQQKYLNPLQRVGEQDISVHVDFTLVAESLCQHQWHVPGLYDQGAWITHGLMAYQSMSQQHAHYPPEDLKLLIHPAEMGTQCQMMVTTSHKVWPDLAIPNHIHRLQAPSTT